MDKKIKLFFFFSLLVSFSSCLSTARLSDFSQTAEKIDFMQIANSEKMELDKEWNSKTEFEYYLKLNTTNNSLIIQSIKDALFYNGYTIQFLDVNKKAVLAKRGLMANEWNSIIGIYFNVNNDESEIYINCKITQDITGGWRDDRAAEIGQTICQFFKGCQQAYPVKTKK
jgi:hypothetical protein